MGSATLPVRNIAYLDGEVITSPRDSPAQAILILDGRIAAIGSNEDIRAAAPPGVPSQGLKGATVIPGLIDNHPHLMHFAAFKAPLVDISDAADHAEIVSRIRAKAASTPKGTWIVCSPIGEAHYFLRKSYKDLREGTFPNRHVLDSATINHPVHIQAWAPKVPNIAGFNTAALEALGIGADTLADTSKVLFEMDAQNNPTGIVRGAVNSYYNSDPYWQKLALIMPPAIRPELLFKSTVEAMAEYNAMGFTAIHESHAMAVEHVDLYKALRKHGALTLRVLCSHELEPNALVEDEATDLQTVKSTLQHALKDIDTKDEWLRVNGITTCAYGPFSCGYVPRKKAYLDPWGNKTHGNRQTSVEKIREAFDFCARTGLQLNVLSCSSEEQDEYIELAKEVKQRYNIDDLHWLIEHGYLMREDQPKQLKDLGFDITVCPGFTHGKGDCLVERMGVEALAELNIFRAMYDAGLKPAASLDWGPTNPWEQMQLAITHMLASGRSNAKPAQSVSREQAYEMWTSNGAEAMRWKNIGSLRVGYQADIAIIDRNPINCPLGSLPHTQVLRTIVAGKIVFDKGVLL